MYKLYIVKEKDLPEAAAASMKLLIVTQFVLASAVHVYPVFNTIIEHVLAPTFHPKVELSNLTTMLGVVAMLKALAIVNFTV